MLTLSRRQFNAWPTRGLRACAALVQGFGSATNGDIDA
jgi:hypothetical protein